MAAVSGLDPSILADPNYQVQMARAQRQMALAQALRQQSLQDTPGNGGSVSWTQGLARLADALSASLGERRAEKNMVGANQGYAAGLARMFGAGQAPQTAQGAPPPTSGPPLPQMAAQAPQGAPTASAPFVPGQPPAAGQADPLAPLPNAPPQAAPQPPASSPAPVGGAPRGPWALTGNPQQDFALYMSNPEEYSKAMIGNAAKGGAPLDTETLVAHARDAMTRGDIATATALLGQLQKSNYIPPTTGRPGGWTIYPDGHKEFNPQAPIPGAVPGQPDAQGNMTWQVPQGTEAAVAARAKSQSAGQAAGAAPYQFKEVYNEETGQMEYVPISSMAGQGGGSLNQHYGVGGSQNAPNGAPGGRYAAGPSLGKQAAFDAYGKGSANSFLNTQEIANSSPQRVQALREMEGLVAGGLSTGPTVAKFQQIAEEHGLPFGYTSNGFVFNKDAARFIAQNASDLGLNGSDARLGMMANASPNMKMTPQALKVVVPTMIGLEYAKMAKATAASSWAQHDPAGNAKFESAWRQAYDPRMFTAYAQGGPQALAHAPANLKQQWLKDYRALKGMGVDFAQFAQ